MNYEAYVASNGTWVPIQLYSPDTPPPEEPKGPQRVLNVVVTAEESAA